MPHFTIRAPTRSILAALAVALAPASAGAQPLPPFGGTAALGEWVETDGARIRVLVGPVDADGTARGAVEIDLEPGWHTYWIAPGPTGIPPRFDAAGSRNVDLVAMSHPAPHRLTDAYGTSVGYEDDVAFPFELAVRDADAPAHLRLGGLLGVCDEICVPVPLAVEGEVPAGRSVPGAVTLPIDMARMGLPLPGRPGALAASVVDGAVTVAGLPEGAEAFVAPPPGLMLAEGEREGGGWRAAILRDDLADDARDEMEGESGGDLTVVVRDGAMETIHRVPLTR